MAVLERDDFFSRIQQRIGDDSSEEAINFMEDMADTYNEMEKRANGDGVDWEQRYHDLDESWRKKYTHRFFSAGGGTAPTPEPQDMSDEREKEERKAERITYSDLFETKGR